MKPYKHTDEEFAAAVAASTNWCMVNVKLGRPHKYAGYETCRRRARSMGLSTAHFPDQAAEKVWADARAAEEAAYRSRERVDDEADWDECEENTEFGGASNGKQYAVSLQQRFVLCAPAQIPSSGRLYQSLPDSWAEYQAALQQRRSRTARCPFFDRVPHPKHAHQPQPTA